MLLQAIRRGAAGAILAMLALALAGNGRPRAAALPGSGAVLAGIDVLAAEGFAALAGKRVGLITNQTGRAADRRRTADVLAAARRAAPPPTRPGGAAGARRTVDVLAAAPGVKLVALFAPEHGLLGRVGDEGGIADSRDAATRLPVFSLYGQTRRPTGEMLAGLDVLVFDIQDAGVRYYTYSTTMASALEAAAKRRIEF